MPLCLVRESNLPLDTTDRRVTKMQMTSPSNVVVDIGRTLKPHEYIRMARREHFDSYFRECASAAGTIVINGLFLKMDPPPSHSRKAMKWGAQGLSLLGTCMHVHVGSPRPMDLI